MRTLQPLEPSQIVIQTGSAVPEWLQIVASISTPATALVGAVAAGAAVRAARAATRQAEQSTAAANRSLEALGRALAPHDYMISASLGRQPIGDYGAISSPTLLRVQVRTPVGPPGIVSVSITSPDGATRLLAPANQLIAAEDAAMFTLEDFACATAGEAFDAGLPQHQEQARAEHVVTLEYTDVRELLRWRTIFRVRETLAAVSRMEGDTVHQEAVPFRALNPWTVEKPTVVELPG